MNKHYYEYNILEDLVVTDEILSFVEKEENKGIFKLVAHDNKIRLKATQFVGSVKIGDNLIEILPKLHSLPDSKSQEAKNLAIKNFLFMLNYSKKLSKLKYFDTSIDKFDGSIFEIFIYIFAKNLLDKLKLNPNRYYVVIDDESMFLKGRWRINEQLTQNPLLKHKFYVSYDEFTDNNYLNQVFKFVAKMLIFRTNINKNLLRNILLILTEINDIPYPQKSDLDKITFNRMNKEFEPIFNLARMFLEENIISNNKMNDKNYSFMFNMNELFEEFIAEFINREIDFDQLGVYKNAKLTTQSTRAYLSKDPEAFQLNPDIFIESDDGNLIIDTKYKLLEKTEDKKMGVSQADAYQMFAYAHKYKCNTVVLLYPQHKDNKIKHTFDLDNNIKLLIKTVNLQQDLENNKKNLKDELKNIFINKQEGENYG